MPESALADLKDGLKLIRLGLIRRNENPKLRSKRPTIIGRGFTHSGLRTKSSLQSFL